MQRSNIADVHDAENSVWTTEKVALEKTCDEDDTRGLMIAEDGVEYASGIDDAHF
jgi:hypothetical protein